MEKIKLNISRDKSLCGAAMPYRVVINGEEKGKLKIGESKSFEMFNCQTSLEVSMVGNAFTFHKVEKRIVLFPSYCKIGTINCVIKSKINWLGLMTCGLLQAVGKLELVIDYR